MKTICVLGACLLAAACSPVKQAATPPAGPTPVSSIHDLMEHVIEASAYTLWDATAITTDETGTHNGHPQTDADWARLRSAAITLSEAPNLLLMPGRAIVPPGVVMEAGGTLDAAAIEARIKDRSASFKAHALGLQSQALKALAAVDARDLAALDRMGGDIDAACEACHVEFWYPPAPEAKKP